MKTAMEVYTEIKNKTVVDDTPRLCQLEVGECTPQGDLYIMRVDAVPDNAVTHPKPELQLVPGNTMGSRHCLDSLEEITLYAWPGSTALDGPLIEAKRQFQIHHPEHGNKIFPPGVYRTGYQRAYAEELRRVID